MVNHDSITAQSVYLFVGSTNPVKIAAVKIAAERQWPQAVVMGFAVASGVGAQPRSDAETRQGATNRARAALQAGLEKCAEEPHFADAIKLGIGLEGGVADLEAEMWSTVWGVVVDQVENTSPTYASSGARFHIPEVVAAEIRQGIEMGVAAEHVSGIAEVKQKGGLIGILTENFTDRTEEYVAIARLSLGVWFGRDWQKPLS